MSITYQTLIDELKDILDDPKNKYMSDVKYKGFIFKHTRIEGTYGFSKLRTGLYAFQGTIWLENMIFSAVDALFGSATSTDGTAPATILHDTAATFVTDGLSAGDVILNVTDGSAATVVTVDSEIKLTTTALTGGTNNEWHADDVWKIPTVYMAYHTGSIEVSAGLDTRTSIPVEGTPCCFTEVVVDVCRYILSSNAFKGPIAIGGGLVTPANVKFINQVLETWRGAMRI